MVETEYLTASDVLALTGWFFQRLGYAAPILRGDGQALLETAVHRAQTAAYYAGADLSLQAACLANGIAVNHPFLDGNKRTALAASLVFLENNGLLPDRKLPINDWEQFVLDVATSKINRDETTRRLRKLLKRSRRS